MPWKTLVNLPPGFFTHPSLTPIFDRLREMGEVRSTSHNTPDEFIADVGWPDGIIMWSWPAWSDRLLDAAPQLKFAGHLDLGQRGAEVALRRGLPVSMARHGWSPAVSEMALTLILNLLRRVSDYHADMRVGRERWVRAFPDDIDVRERQLTGRSVGIIGFGAIGRRLAELLAPFRCPLMISDPFVQPAVAEQFNARQVEIDELVASNEVVVVAASANAGTVKLLGPAQINALRRDAVLLVISRASLVDTDALIARLRQNDMQAAIDVFDHEPLPTDHPLRTLPNAYLTPHRCGGVIESVQRILGWLVDDLDHVRAGRPRVCALHPHMVPTLDA